MAKINFVGFQEHVEIPEGFELLEIKDEIQSSLSRDELFSYLSEPAKISEWFYQVLSLESKSSGKGSYISSNGATSQAICIAYDGGREISLLADEFGEFTGRVHGKKIANLSIKFRILTDNPEPIQGELMNRISNLRKIVA
jgi:hypothetical protein